MTLVSRLQDEIKALQKEAAELTDLCNNRETPRQEKIWLSEDINSLYNRVNILQEYMYSIEY